MAPRSYKPAPPGPSMTDHEKKELDDRLARLVGNVRQFYLGDQRHLLWMEYQDGESRIMTWHPETPDEVAAANRFYDAAHGLGAFTRLVPKGRPRRRSPDEAALVRGIIAARDDDTGYLVYADYLSEWGNTQGDFIRASVELRRTPEGDPRRHELDTRRNELLVAGCEEWVRPVGELGLRPMLLGHFHPDLWFGPQGVIDQVTIDRPGILPGQAARLFAAAPFLRKLAFERGHLDPAGLARVRQLKQIDELKLSHTDLTPDGLRTLTRSRYLTGVRKLDVGSNPLGDRGAEVLAASGWMNRLEALSVSQCELTDVGVEALVGSPPRSQLKELRYGYGWFGARSSRAFARLPNLEVLNLNTVPLDAEAATAFRSAAFADRLRELELTNAAVEPGAVERLATCRLPALRALELAGTRLTAATHERLSAAPFAAALARLGLDNTSLGVAGLGQLAAGRFPALLSLDLSRNQLGTQGMELLARSEAFPAMNSLKLWDNRITSAGAVALAGWPGLATVTELNLQGNKIGPGGAAALAASEHLRLLNSLTVDERTVGKKGRRALLDRFGDRVVTFV